MKIKRMTSSATLFTTVRSKARNQPVSCIALLRSLTREIEAERGTFRHHRRSARYRVRQIEIADSGDKGRIAVGASGGDEQPRVKGVSRGDLANCPKQRMRGEEARAQGFE